VDCHARPRRKRAPDQIQGKVPDATDAQAAGDQLRRRWRRESLAGRKCRGHLAMLRDRTATIPSMAAVWSSPRISGFFRSW
jgi:hypothetical protein